jgi:AbrB family looped-hinge helix DNA binding protein
MYFFTVLEYAKPMKARKLATISAKGQTTIPRDVRTKLGLNPGDHILFEFDENEKGEVVLRKVRAVDEQNDWNKFMEMTLAPEWGTDDDDDL